MVVGAGCGPRRVDVVVPQGYSQVQSASLAQLVERINSRYASVETLTVGRFQVKFTGGSVSQGYLKKYPSGKGHLVTKRPNWIFLNILNPVTSSTVVTMASDNQDFQMWVPRENKYVIGKTSVKAASEDPLYSVRPDHLLPALMIAPIEDETVQVLEESQDGRQRFYVIHSIRIDQGQACLSRKVWIERAQLEVVRQQYFNCGQLVSDIQYGEMVESSAGPITHSITLERIPEHYSIAFTFIPDSVRINRTVPTSRFFVMKPPKAEVVMVESEDTNP